MSETIVVIGANHAGTAAINTILDNYKDKHVVVFDRSSAISFLGCGMALWIGRKAGHCAHEGRSGHYPKL